jgi:ABC-type transport system substrate-binding protein
LRWNQESVARLVELQSGTADFITYISPGDFEAVEADPNSQLIPHASPNMLVPWFHQHIRPFRQSGRT